MVHHTAQSQRSPLLRSLISLAHDMGLEVIAEGAETESDVIELSQLGCEFAQGSAFGQSMTHGQARKTMGARPEAA